MNDAPEAERVQVRHHQSSPGDENAPVRPSKLDLEAAVMRIAVPLQRWRKCGPEPLKLERIVDHQETLAHVRIIARRLRREKREREEL